MDVTSLVCGMNGKLAAQRAHCGRVKAKLGREAKVCLPMALVKAMCATMRCTSSGCMGLVTRSLFLAGLGAGKGGVELSRGPGHDVPGNEWALVAGLPLPKGTFSPQEKPLSPWTGCDKNGEGCGEGMNEKERERRAPFSWPVSFESFDVRHGVVMERGFSFLSLCHRVVFMEARGTRHPRTSDEALTRAWRVITDNLHGLDADPDNADTKVHAMQRRGTTILTVSGGRADQTRNDGRSRTPRETTPELGEQDCWIQRRVEDRRASQSPNRQDRHALKKMWTLQVERFDEERAILGDRRRSSEMNEPRWRSSCAGSLERD